MTSRYSLTVLALSVWFGVAFPEVASAADTPRPFSPHVKPVLRVMRAPSPIVVDGELDEQLWISAERAEQFAEVQPGDKTQPESRTVGMIAYDDDYLYIGMIAYDDPSGIRATRANRDEIFQDDFMGVMLDPHGESIRVYEIYANPLGIQGDLLWSNTGEDDSFDLIYESAGKITSEGYQIELKIPFRSLRFPSRPVQEWRATFWRTRPRESRFQYSWASIDRDSACFFCQLGTLSRFEGISSGGGLEVLPSVVGSQTSAGPKAIDFGTSPRASFSLGARYPITTNSIIEATINPDFSQVESDAAQVDINSNFALSYPERRPFFQEGADLFRTPTRIVYTRSINDPIAATKFTLREGGTDIAYLGAIDEHSAVVTPLEERSVTRDLGKSVVNVLRANHALSGDDNIGIIFSDRRFTPSRGSNTVAGADAKILITEQLYVSGQLYGSQTVGMEDSTEYAGYSNAGGLLDGRSATGYSASSSIFRYTRHLDFELSYLERSADFRAATGYVNRNNNRNASFWSGYKIQYEDNPWLVELRPNLGVGRIWNFAGEQKDQWVNPAVNATLKAQTEVRVDYLWSKEKYKGVVIPGIERFHTDLTSHFSELASLGGSVTVGRSIARNTETPYLGYSKDYELWTVLKPVNGLVLRPSYIYARLDDTQQVNQYAGSIWRVSSSYQFTKEFSARVVVQYDGFDKALALEPLLTYRLNPFSIFYIGSTHGYANRFGSADTVDLALDRNQYFAKFQYLFQM